MWITVNGNPQLKTDANFGLCNETRWTRGVWTCDSIERQRMTVHYNYLVLTAAACECYSVMKTKAEGLPVAANWSSDWSLKRRKTEFKTENAYRVARAAVQFPYFPRYQSDDLLIRRGVSPHENPTHPLSMRTYAIGFASRTLTKLVQTLLPNPVDKYWYSPASERIKYIRWFLPPTPTFLSFY